MMYGYYVVWVHLFVCCAWVMQQIGHFPTSYPRVITNNGQQGQLIDDPTTSCMAHLRERYKCQQLLEEALYLMLSSWRTSPMTYYFLSDTAGVLNGSFWSYNPGG